MGQSVVRDMRTTVYKKILGLNLKQFDTTPIGTLTTRTINDIESINDIFSDGLIPIFADLLSIVIVLVTMFVTDWRLSLIALIPFPLLILATYYFKESVNKSFIQVRNAVAALNAFVQEPMAKRVLAVTGNFFSRSLKPNPLARITLFFSTTATETPTAFHSFSMRLTKLSRPASRLS